MKPGIGDLRTPVDLFGKLQREYQQILDDRNNPDHTFNFFVTSFHLVDWLHPDNKKIRDNQSLRDGLVASHPGLQICSHIANGAKHLQLLGSHHTHVSSVEPGGHLFGNPQNADGTFRSGSPESGLIIELLDGKAKEKYGERVFAIRLAKEMLEFWRDHLKINP